jgi:transposase
VSAANQFKARVALEALKGIKTIQQIAKDSETQRDGLRAKIGQLTIELDFMRKKSKQPGLWGIAPSWSAKPGINPKQPRKRHDLPPAGEFGQPADQSPISRRNSAPFDAKSPSSAKRTTFKKTAVILGSKPQPNFVR